MLWHAFLFLGLGFFTLLIFLQCGFRYYWLQEEEDEDGGFRCSFL
jgi:hypothetical protein